MFIPYENYIDGYDRYQVCYDYEELELPQTYTEHIPSNGKYTISHQTKTSSLVYEDGNIKESIKINVFDYGLYINKENKLMFKNLNTDYEVELSLLDNITCMSMMGEYLLYYNGKLSA